MQAVQIDPELLKRGNDMGREVADSMERARGGLLSLEGSPMFGLSMPEAAEIEPALFLVHDQLCRLLDEGRSSLSWVIQHTNVVMSVLSAADKEGAETIAGERPPGPPPGED